MTTQADLDLGSHKVVRDERVKERNRLQRLLIRPEMGALIGAVAIFIFFASFGVRSAFLVSSSELFRPCLSGIQGLAV